MQVTSMGISSQCNKKKLYQHEKLVQLKTNGAVMN